MKATMMRSTAVLIPLIGSFLLVGCATSPDMPPPDGPIAPNGSQVTATVSAIQVGADGTVERVSLEILTAEPLEDGLPNAVNEGDVAWAAVAKGVALDDSILGQDIRATLRRVGDERGQDLRLSDVEILDGGEGASR